MVDGRQGRRKRPELLDRPVCTIFCKTPDPPGRHEQGARLFARLRNRDDRGAGPDVFGSQTGVCARSDSKLRAGNFRRPVHTISLGDDGRQRRLRGALGEPRRFYWRRRRAQCDRKTHDARKDRVPVLRGVGAGLRVWIDPLEHAAHVAALRRPAAAAESSGLALREYSRHAWAAEPDAALFVYGGLLLARAPRLAPLLISCVLNVC
mmetsp:Transcript_16593/g.51836  ORF Transcript_16593/g.51836 Transcript_16593/m.51836 type:complete len:207 (-) Transcript_16593:9-629(-)